MTDSTSPDIETAERKSGIRTIRKVVPYLWPEGNSWVKRRVVLALLALILSKVIAVAVLIRGIDLFRAFDYMFVMTSGGPGTSTYTLSLYAWQQTFSFIKWGYGATLSLVSLILILIIANLFIWIAKVRW